jgi:enediyne core biosynthesis thioesterase
LPDTNLRHHIGGRAKSIGFCGSALTTPYYEYRHVAGLEETNLTGNVNFVNHIRWQGRCREMFLKDHAPGVMRSLFEDLRLVTLSCACNYLAELTALDEISIRLYLQSLTQNRITLRFEYWRVGNQTEELVAEGRQEIACMRRAGNTLKPKRFRPSCGARLLLTSAAETRC